jgi:hypothetical protein
VERCEQFLFHSWRAGLGNPFLIDIVYRRSRGSPYAL